VADAGEQQDPGRWQSTAPVSRPFTPIDVPGAAFTQPLGINNRGQIVGSYSDPAAGGRPPAL